MREGSLTLRSCVLLRSNPSMYSSAALVALTLSIFTFCRSDSNWRAEQQSHTIIDYYTI